jgi:hypothetical protein
MSLIESTKIRIARLSARALRVRQIHIVGCARSGTNMAHFAMLAFRGVVVTEQESTPEYPGLGDLLKHYRRGEIGRRPSVLVTKRGYRWSEPDQLQKLIDRIRDGELGLIYIVRDPRDVLLSFHDAAGKDKGYVSVQRWHASMMAGERLQMAVGDRPTTLVLRYEDFAQTPVLVQERIADTFKLRLRPEITDISDIQKSIETSNVQIAANRVRSMHKIRPIDAASVGKWRRAPQPYSSLEAYPDLRADFEAMIKRYGYDSPSVI